MLMASWEKYADSNLLLTSVSSLMGCKVDDRCQIKVPGNILLPGNCQIPLIQLSIACSTLIVHSFVNILNCSKQH